MALKYVLLTLLTRERQTGYEIVKTFESAVGYFWSASHQQVYRELSKLTVSGEVRFSSVSQGDKPDKKLYRITAGGKRELRRWLEQPVAETPGKDLLLVKLLNLNRDNVHLMIAELDRKIELAVERQLVYQSIESEHYKPARVAKLSPEELSLYLALRRGLSSIEATIDWLREARALILKSVNR